MTAAVFHAFCCGAQEVKRSEKAAVSGSLALVYELYTMQTRDKTFMHGEDCNLCRHFKYFLGFPMLA